MFWEFHGLLLRWLSRLHVLKENLCTVKFAVFRSTICFQRCLQFCHHCHSQEKEHFPKLTNTSPPFHTRPLQSPFAVPSQSPGSLVRILIPAVLPFPEPHMLCCLLCLLSLSLLIQLLEANAYSTQYCPDCTELSPRLGALLLVGWTAIHSPVGAYLGSVICGALLS